MGLLADDVGNQYQKAFQTIRQVVAACPDDRWKERHGGDGYYVPCRLAYHLALVVRFHLLGGYRDKEYYNTLPYGRWNETKTEDLPGKDELVAYMDGIFSQASKALEELTDESLAEPPEPERAWAGASALGLHLYLMRELSAHTGELNTMLVGDGAEDIIWVR